MTKIGTIIHTKASSSDPNIVRGILHADNYYIWKNSSNSWIPYYQSITSLTGTWYGDGSGLTGIVAGAGSYLPLSGGTLTGPVTGGYMSLTSLSASSLSGNGTGIPHSSLSGILNNDHIQYALSSSLSSYALTSSLSSYSLTSHIHTQYTLTSDMVSYSLTSHVHNYLPLSGGSVTGLSYFTAGLSANSISGYINSNAGFVLENRTSDPGSPVIGQIWIRTDL